MNLVMRFCRYAMFLLIVAGVQFKAQAGQDFPFEFRDGLIWVRVSVANSPEPLNFLLDSGAGVSVIDLKTAHRLKVRLGERVAVRGVSAQATGYWPQQLAARVNEVVLPKKYLAVDLQKLSDACVCHVDGLIGADFFQARIVQLDFETRKIRLLESGELKADGEVLPLENRRRSLQTMVRVNGAPARWTRLDTGCASALQWVVAGALPAELGGKVSIGLADLKITQATTTVQLGDTLFEAVPTGLHDTELFAGESGLLGIGLLARFERVTIDAKGGRLILENRRVGH
ncbi:MAG: hypothetical protein HY298_22305 [Verrucomicrobia bacterium]|nr:hypothetical protein [Verrucomicrobiota bacterium]